jgi:hypothetical protein
MQNHGSIALGIAWYRREQWDRLRDVSVDSEFLEKTWDEWVANARERFIEMSIAGFRAERIDVDVERLIQWCRSNRRLLDGEARAEYVTQKLAEKHGKTRQRSNGADE